MSATFDGLTSVILTIFSGVSELTAAYDYHTEVVSGYPAASFEPTGNTNEIYTTAENLREYSFEIYIQQEISVAGRQAAIANLRKAVDAVITAFDTDDTLMSSGGAHYVRALPSDWGEFVGQSGPIRFAKLTLTIGYLALVT